MRFLRTLWVSVLVVMTACPAIAAISFRVVAEPSLPVHNIDTGVSYATIQEALDDNITLNGHTIQVDAGAYYGTVNVSKAVSLIGEDPLNTIIDGEGEETVLFIQAPSVVIAGFTIRNSSSVSGSAGVFVVNSDRCNISSNIIVENWYGVWLKSCSNPIISDNSFLNNSDGFYADSVSDGFVFGNVFLNNDFAVWLNDANSMVFRLNNVSGNNYGVWMARSSNVSLNENLISENSDGVLIYDDSTRVVLSDNTIYTNSSYGLFMNGVADSSAINNHVLSKGKEAILVQNSRNNNFTGNTAISNGHDAISLELSDTNLLADNIVNGSAGAIEISSSSGNVLLANHLQRNTFGIKLSGSVNNTVAGNEITNSTLGISLTSSSVNNSVSDNNLVNCIKGLDVERSAHNQFVGNSIYQSSIGAFLLDAQNITLFSNSFQNGNVGLILNLSSSNLVHNNNISGNVDGLRLFESNNNTVETNIVSFNFGKAIAVSKSDFNVIVHNGFFNNSQISTSSNSSNMWDNGFEGNFWGYDGLVDSNQDGIADQPFVLEDEEKDNFPLMGLYRELSTIFESREYIVGIVTNSSVSNLRFGQTGENALPTVTFRVSTVEGTIFCRTSVPHAMVVAPFDVTIDNNPVSFQNVVGSNSTHTWLYFLFPLGGDVRIVTAASARPFWAEFWFWGIAVLGIVVAVLTSAIFLFYRRLTSYRKTMEEVERKLRERESSPLEVARRMFSSDVERRSVKIGEFEEKYGVKIRPRESLDEIFRGLEKKNKRRSEEDEADS